MHIWASRLALAALLALACLASIANSKALFGWWEGSRVENEMFTATSSALERVLGKRLSVLAFYSDMCVSEGDTWFAGTMADIWAQGRVPLFNWKGVPCDTEDQSLPFAPHIAAGRLDDYIRRSAQEIFKFLKGPDGRWGTKDDRRLFVNLSWEMNGNWYTGYSGEPATYKKMYHRIVKILRSVIPQDKHTKDRIQFMWVVNHFDVGGPKAEKFYPGSKYVDWVGMTGYNWGYGKDTPWKSPKQVFAHMMKRLKKYKKPIAITESGSASFVNSPKKRSIKKKNNWISSQMKYLQGSKVKMAVWFNQMKERDWQNFGPAKCGNKRVKVSGKTYYYYSAFRTGLKNKYWMGTSEKLRLISDRQFRGHA